MTRPIELPSWLRLERHALGELPADQARQVEEAIEHDAATRASWELIAGPTRLRPISERAEPRKQRTVRLRWLWPAPLATAAVLVLLILLRPREQDAPHEPPRIKGGDIALTLVREHDGVTSEQPDSFGPDDRFKARLTCTPGMEGTWDLAVFQAGRVFFPLQSFAVGSCGNDLPIEGAFALDGNEPATICSRPPSASFGSALAGSGTTSSACSTTVCVRWRAARPSRASVDYTNGGVSCISNEFSMSPCCFCR
jgi:hypothetical protein